MKFYYILSFVILPITLLAACSASGTKKPTQNNFGVAVIKQVERNTQSKNITSLEPELNTITTKEFTMPESEKYPLTQVTNIEAITRPAKRIYQFGFDKQKITDEEKQSLVQHAEYLIATPDSVLVINGHSDTQGNRAYNILLSAERAKKVARFLVNYGVSESQIKTYGLGDSQPLNDVHNFRENRRVELEYNDSRVAIK